MQITDQNLISQPQVFKSAWHTEGNLRPNNTLIKGGTINLKGEHFTPPCTCVYIM